MREQLILSTNFVELANEGHGKQRASREASDGAHCGREEGKLYPDRIGCEMVARGAGGLRGCEREALLFVFFLFFFLTECKLFQSGRK